MTILSYDGSFDGLLTAVFEVYERQLAPARLVPPERSTPEVFGETLSVITDLEKANRVWQGLEKRLSKQSLSDIYSGYLSELPEREDRLLAFIRLAFDSPSEEKVEENFRDPNVLWVAQTGRKLFREKHRFEAFVRFQALADGTHYAAIDPDFNVIPLIIPHFVRRYNTLEWIIYDSRRRYGAHWDGQRVEEVRFEFASTAQQRPGLAPAASYGPEEELYQHLWQDYYRSVNIPVRKNLKLHRQHVPQRYWKYLVEKQPERS